MVEDILVPLIIFGSVSAIVIVIALLRHKERMGLIDKGINPYIYGAPPAKFGGKTLFLGIFAVAIGLALIISAILLLNFNRGMLTAGVLCVFGGGALVGYWKLTAPDRERAQRLHEERLARLDESHPTLVNEQETPESIVEDESRKAQ